jgi:DNA polymerase III subunit delta
MAKRKDNYERSYTAFLGEMRKGEIPPSMLLFIKDKILLDELIRTIAKKFIGDDYNPKQHLISFFTDESDTGIVLNECCNTGMFSDKKIVLLRVIRKPGYRGFNEDEAKALTAYFKNPNPDVKFIIIDNSPEAKSMMYDKIKDPHLEIIALGDLSETEFVKWVKHKFGDYKIDDDSVMHLIQLLNMSVDEISQEIEKLKTYALDSKEITKDDINLCIGFSRDFNENDFIYSVLQRDANSALKIYNNLILKRDVEIFLLFLLNSVFTALSKMFDPKIGNYSGWDLRMKLKIWNEFDKMFPVYKKYRGEINELKLKQAFGYIEESEKALKSSGKDKKTVFTRLITNLVNL